MDHIFLDGNLYNGYCQREKEKRFSGILKLGIYSLLTYQPMIYRGKHPKASGYKSFHMQVSLPIFLSDRVVDTMVEIQIRTIAMDFWASLEHKIYYKFEGNAPDYISRDLRECAEIVSNLDAKMLQLNTAILAEKAKMEEEKKLQSEASEESK